MKKLSNSELRTLYIRKIFLDNFIQSTALRMDYIDTSTSENNRNRINRIIDEIKNIIQDPSYGDMVSYPRHSSRVPYLIINTLNSAKELQSYIDTILKLHLSAKSQELKEDPHKKPKIFIGHGRNEIVRHKVKNFVRDRLGYETLVLQELASSGLTIIEKLEQYGRLADYAILILTADDITDQGKARARQNVLQELGWFQGVLGRKSTAILCQSGVEIASNLAGVVYLEFKDNDVEIVFDTLRKEIENSVII